MTSSPSWTFRRARFLFSVRDVRGAEAPLASATKDGVLLRSDLDFSVWNPDSNVGNYKLVEPDDFVIGLRSFQHGISHSAVTGIVSPAYTVLRSTAAADPRYFRYYFRSSLLVSHLANLTQGIRQGQAIDVEAFRNLALPLPPLNEQRRIADFLDAETARIDRLVGLQLALRAKLEERDRTLRDALVDQLAASAGEIPLRRFMWGIEQGASPQCDAIPRQSETEWGVLKLSSVKRGCFFADEHKRLPDGTEPTRAYEVKAGDLLVTRANTPNLVGDVAVVRGDVRNLLLPDLIYRVRLMPSTSAQYIAEVAMSSRVRLVIESVARGSSQSMVKLRGEDIKSWPIPAAAPREQEDLVSAVERGTCGTAKLQRAVGRQLSLLTERRQALITAAVTGQFDVSTASGRNITE
ncbi:restriction endonuclease subunit S [Streptomyces cyaneofuscatus]|uniref:restriction endonuclease subunit S n=1 Tax=Streptomyces cyaneofuscatus TaxID=66883 RepID=UPI0033BEC46C